MHKIRFTAALLTGALALSACGNGGADGAAVGGKGPISEERTTAFKSFMPTYSSMRKMANGDEAFDAEAFKKLAASFVQEARVPFEHFQSDDKGNGDALPAVWEKAAEFKAEQDKFLAAVDNLNTAAQSGKLEDIKAAYDATSSSCKSCHDTFRRPK